MKALLFSRIMIFALLACLSATTMAQPYFVASDGDDDNSGTQQAPLKTIEHAISLVKAGETIFIRGGTYYLTSTIDITNSGKSDSLISLFSFPGERPVLDFSSQSLGGSNRGIKLTGHYWHIKGIDITGAGDNGMKIEGGSYNIIENCAFYRNRDTGLQLDNGASDNTILNCDSYFNADPTDYGDADGFAPKMTVGSGNYFYGCRAWKNCDDGWDGYLRGTNDVSNSAENCWAFENGYMEDGSDPGSQANGNGFKMGGSDDKTLQHNFTLQNCLAFKNKAKGFDQNNNKGSMILYNCTGYNNLTANFRIVQELATGKILIVKNCIDVGGQAEIGSFAEQEKNSWMSPFDVTPEDFISLDESSAYGPRNADGSLPEIDYLHLASGSDLLNAGVDVGLPFAGALPDLGCFESSITGFQLNRMLWEVSYYPNPLCNSGILFFSLAAKGRCVVSLYDMTGRCVKTMADQDLPSGEQNISLQVSELPEGLYIIRISLDDATVYTGKLMKSNSVNL